MATFETDAIDAAIPGFNAEYAGEGYPRSVLELLEKLKLDHEGRWEAVRNRAAEKDRLVEGDQWSIVDDGDEYDDGPRATRNLLTNLWLAWSARVLEDRRSVKARPNEASTEDVGAVEVADKLIEWIKRREDLDDKDHEAAGYVQSHGAVAYKVFWDPEAGPPSRGYWVETPDGQVVLEGDGAPVGDVRIEIVTVYDFMTDGARPIEEAEWVVFKKLIGVTDARQSLRDAGIEEEPDIFDGDEWNSAGDDTSLDEGAQVDVVEVCELWHRPCATIPEGLYAEVVSGHVVSATVYPYEHGELPLGVWTVNKKRGALVPEKTHVDHAMNIQLRLNWVETAIHRHVVEMRNVWMVVPPSIIGQMQAGNRALAWSPTKGEDARRSIFYVEPPQIPQALREERAELGPAMYDVFGLNQMLTGAGDGAGSASGRAIAFRAKLDSQKLAGVAKNHDKCKRRIFRQALKLYQQFAQEERLVQVVGEGGRFETVAFRGADIGGVDIFLEEASGLGLTRAGASDQYEQDVAAGIADPAQIPAVRDTGLTDPVEAGFDAGLVEDQVMRVLQTGVPEPAIEGVTAEAGLAVIAMAQAALERRGVPPERLAPLAQLRMAYETLAQSQAQAAQAEQEAMRQSAGQAPSAQPPDQVQMGVPV